jgi:peroxiredoxin family protein
MTAGVRDSVFSSTDAIEAIAQLERRVVQLERAGAEPKADPNRVNLLVFDGHQDRLLAALVIATGAAAVGMQVTMFFTFWGTAALRKSGAAGGSKSWVERAFGWLLPASARRAKLSNLDMCGVGRALLQREMRKKKIADVDTLIQVAADLGVKIRVCDMSMRLMGIDKDELIDYPEIEFCGVASFVDDAATANTTLFI